MPGAYIVPKGNPAGRDAVMQFIATAQEVPAQLKILDCLGMTPANPEAFSQIPEGSETLCHHLGDEYRQYRL